MARQIRITKNDTIIDIFWNLNVSTTLTLKTLHLRIISV